MDYYLTLINQLFLGALVTLKFFILIGIVSLFFGLLVSILGLVSNSFIKRIINIYVLIMRGTPLLLQLITIYFGLPIIGLSLSRTVAVLIAFALNYSAYFSEIFRGGFESIDKGQFEAAFVLGMKKRDTYKKIVLPQVIKRVLPSISNEIITLVKDTSLIYVVGLGELLRMGKIASNRDASLVPLLFVGLIYLLIIYALTKLLKRWERSYGYFE
ncbi:amino acid ABC transporter permease [Mycoplasmatota bacterium]|nr:amino acid ABC transporter permease [Mycoplasmatota bacterium]